MPGRSNSSNRVLNGTKNADVIVGSEDNDIINSGAGDDVLNGGDGDDQLHAGAGDDILEGGKGDDILNGGGGSDTYLFNFTVSAGGTTTITYDPVPLDYDAPTGNPNSPVPPDGAVSSSEFAQFLQDYQAWLDLNAPADYTYDAPQSDPLTSASSPELVDGAVSSVLLTNSQTRYWEPTIEVPNGGLEITDSDGNDTITQFQNAGPNADKIVLNGLAGLTDAQLDGLFDLSTSDVDGDGALDSVLSWDGGSITILGSSQWGSDVLDFFHSSQVVLA